MGKTRKTVILKKQYNVITTRKTTTITTTSTSTKSRITTFALVYFPSVKHKGLGSLTINFCTANFENIILQRASKCFNDYKI